MTLNSTSGPSPIFENGKLKPGVYKIQNIFAENYLDIELHSRNVCCRPAKDLGEGRGLWEIKRLGPGYTVQRFHPGEPEQFCTPLNGLQDGVTLLVGPYPVAWRVEIVNDENHRGFGYVRFYWGTKKIAWDLIAGKKDNGASVATHFETANPFQVWRLVPVKVESTFTSTSFEMPESGSLPSYERDGGQSSTRAQHAESGRDELGTIVDEVTVVTTTATTRRRYRVEDV